MTLSSRLKSIYSRINDGDWKQFDENMCRFLEKDIFKEKISDEFDEFVDNTIDEMNYEFYKVLKDMKEKARYIYANKEIVYDKFRKRGVNNSLAEKYNENGNYWNSFHNLFSLIYYLIFLVILVITFLKNQYKNYKIFVYLLAFFLLSFSIFPIYEKINGYFYNTNRIVQLILSYSFLVFIFLLLNSFTNYVFDVENTEGKRDMFILYSVFGVTTIIVFFRYMVYNYGIKEFVSP